MNRVETDADPGRLVEDGFRAAAGARYWPVAGWAGLVALGVLLYAVQLGPLEHVKGALIVNDEVSAKSVGARDALSVAVAALTVGDWIILGCLAVAGLALVAGILRHRFRFPFLARTVASRWQSAALVLLIAAVAVQWCVSPGPILGYDAEPHFGHSAQVMFGLEEGYLPIWTNYWYSGAPLDQFSHVLYHLLAGTLGFVLGNLDLSIKLLIFVSYIASALGVFLFLRSVTGSNAAGILGSVAYALSFQHTYTIAWVGKMPIMLIYALVPYLFWAYERYRRGHRPWFWTAVAALLLAALVLAHPAAGPNVAILFVGYALLRCCLAGGRAATAVFLLAAGGLSLGMTQYLLLGGMLEKSLVSMGAAKMPLADLGFHPPGPDRLEWMLAWRNRWTSDIIAYQGISILLLFCVSVVAAVFRRRLLAVLLPLAACAAFIFCTVGEGVWATYNIYPFVFLTAAGAGFLPVVWSPSRSGAVAPAGRAGLNSCESSYQDALGLNPCESGDEDGPAPVPVRLLAVGLALLVIDLGPTTIQSPGRSDRQFEVAMRERLAESLDGHRAVFISRRDGRYATSEWLGGWDSPVATVTGGYPESATAILPFSRGMVTCVASDLNQGEFRPETVAMLAAWDVRQVATATRREYVVPEIQTADGITTDDRLPTLRTPGTPALFAPAIRKLTPHERDLCEVVRRIGRGEWPDEMGPEGGPGSEALRQLVSQMGIDPRRGVAEAFFCEGDALPGNPPGNTGVGHGPLRIEAFSRDTHTMELTADVPADGYLRLSQACYPFQEVILDGRPLEPMRDVTNCIVVPVTGGRHTIRVVARLSRLRVICGIGSLASLGLTLVVVAVGHRAGRRTHSTLDGHRA